MPYTVTLAMPTRISDSSAVTETTTSYGIQYHTIYATPYFAAGTRSNNHDTPTYGALVSGGTTDEHR